MHYSFKSKFVIAFRAGGFSSRLFIVDLLRKKMNWKNSSGAKAVEAGQRILPSTDIFICLANIYCQEFIKNIYILQVVLHAL